MGDKEWFMRGEVDAGAPQGAREPGRWHLLARTAVGQQRRQSCTSDAPPDLLHHLALHLLPFCLQAAAPRTQPWRSTSTLTQQSSRRHRWAPRLPRLIGRMQLQPGRTLERRSCRC